MSEIVYEEFLPKVFVYKGLLPNSQEIAEYTNNFIDNNLENPIWRQHTEWGVFGENISFDMRWLDIPQPPINFNNDDEEKTFYTEKAYVQEIVDAFNVSTEHYFTTHNVEKQEDLWPMQPAICRYNVTTEENYRGEGITGPQAMTYHTDYELLKAEMPGDKFVLTCTMYLNDGYEGGGVEFLVNGEPHLYTPKAGDVVVFPSGHPDYFSEEFTYFHGVEAISGSPKKIFVRSFWMQSYPGSEEWLANQEKYGAEVWAEMEKARIVAGMRLPDHMRREIEVEKPITLEDLGIDPDKECGLEEFRS